MAKKIIFIIIGLFTAVFLIYKYLDFYYEQARCLGDIQISNDNYSLELCRGNRFKQWADYTINFKNSTNSFSKEYRLFSSDSYHFVDDFKANEIDSIIYIRFKDKDKVLFFLNLKTMINYTYDDERTHNKESDSILKKYNPNLTID
ncbi:MAG: hypothetical protein ACK5IC_04330 [Moheibacter sp.]